MKNLIIDFKKMQVYYNQMCFLATENRMKKTNFSGRDLRKSWMNFQRVKVITLGERLIIKDKPL